MVVVVVAVVVVVVAMVLVVAVVAVVAVLSSWWLPASYSFGGKPANLDRFSNFEPTFTQVLDSG